MSSVDQAARQHQIDRQRIEALEAENDDLRERLAQMEARVFGIGWRPPMEFMLTSKEGAIVATLLAHPEGCSKPQLLDALYAHLPNADEPEIKIIDVFICKARKKLKPYGLEIETMWGAGYRFAAASIEALRNWGQPKADEAA